LENSNANSNLNQNLSLENSKLKGGIYLNENLEKHRKARLGVEYVSKNSNSNLNKARNKNNNLSNTEILLPKGGFSPALIQKPQDDQKHVELQKTGSIVHQGWVKYFKFTNKALTILTPKQFIKNPGYYEQKRFFPKEDFSKPNSDGDYEYLRDENYFYLTIFPGYLIFNQSKRVFH